MFPPAAAVIFGTLGGLWFSESGYGRQVVGWRVFNVARESVGSGIAESVPDWVLPAFLGFTVLVVVVFFAGLWVLRKKPGRKRSLRGVWLHCRSLFRSSDDSFFLSQTQLRYRHGSFLYKIGLLALFCVAVWNAMLNTGSAVSELPAGKSFFLCLKVRDFPVEITTAAGKRYQQMDCQLLMYSPDGAKQISGNENIVVYVAADTTGGNGSGGSAENAGDISIIGSAGTIVGNGSGGSADQAGGAVRGFSYWMPGDILLTRCRTYPIASTQNTAPVQALASESTVPAPAPAPASESTAPAPALASESTAPAPAPATASSVDSTASASASVSVADPGGDSVAATSASAQNSTFDYPKYMARRGFFSRAYVYQYQRAEGRLTVVERFRRLRGLLTRRWKGEAGALLSGICLGDKSGIGRDVRNKFTAAGAGHILAVSGLHVGVLYGSLILLLGLPLRVARVGRYRKKTFVKCSMDPVDVRARQLALHRTYSLSAGSWVHAPALLLIWSYAAVVGFSASVVRAALMLSIYGVGKVLGYRTFGLNVLSVTALILVVIKPLNLFDPGFQLSFSAVLGLMLFFPLLRNLLSVRNVILKYLWELFCCSLAVQLGTLWLATAMFGVIPVYGLLCNFVVVPFGSVILYVFLAYLMVLGAVTVVGAPAVAALEHITHLLHYLAGILERGVDFFAQLPGNPIHYQPDIFVQLLMLWCTGYFYLAWSRKNL
jgi:ComEC/Rec2-related protein